MVQVSPILADAAQAVLYFSPLPFLGGPPVHSAFQRQGDEGRARLGGALGWERGRDMGHESPPGSIPLASTSCPTPVPNPLSVPTLLDTRPLFLHFCDGFPTPHWELQCLRLPQEGSE